MPIKPFVTDVNLSKFIAVTDEISKKYAGQLEGWTESPFAWLLTLPSRSRGAAGEAIVDRWLTGNGCSVARSGNTDCDRIINGRKMEIKFSTLWRTGGYVFQQVRDQDYAFVLCLGISPLDVHAWCVPKSVMWSNTIPQHGGKEGKDTKWLSFQASNPPTWLKQYGGSLSEALVVIQNSVR